MESLCIRILFIRTFFTRIFAGIVLCGIVLAQNTPASQPSTTNTQAQQNSAAAPANSPANAPMRVSAGSVIPVQLTKTIDAKKVKTGDPVEGRVTQDMKAQNGEVLVPRDTKVIGHVTEVQARDKGQKESQIGIAFDHAAIKNGPEMQLPMSIQAIVSQESLNPNNNNDNSLNPNKNNSSANTASPSPSAGGTNPGRSGTGGNTPPPNPSADAPATTQPASNSHQPITGNTEGVVGFSNLKLSNGANAAEGSVVSSEKNNVKLDSGTLMLLRVNQ